MVFVEGAALGVDAIEAWERTRARVVARRLQRRLHRPRADLTVDVQGNPRPIGEVRADLADLKTSVTADALRDLLAAQTALSTIATKLIDAVSRHRRRSSIIEMLVEGCPAAELLDRYFLLMLESSPAHRRLGLIANPDHYVLEPAGRRVQEVVETIGGSPMASRFFIHYGDEEGLTSSADPGFPCQAAGVCRLADGTPIGGVRHQMRDEPDGQVRVRLEVEFPRALPQFMIRQHQLHLACEFRRWFTELSTPDHARGDNR